MRTANTLYNLDEAYLNLLEESTEDEEKEV